MASLDKMEGDLIEGALVLLVVVLAVLFFGIWRGVGSPLQALGQALQKLVSLFQGSSFPSVSTVANGAGVGYVNAGSSGWTAQNEADYQAELLDAFNGGQMTLGQYESFAAPVGGQ